MALTNAEKQARWKERNQVVLTWRPVEQSNRPAVDDAVLDKAEAALDTALDKAAFDKKAYQRALMRARRATKRVVPLKPYGATTTAPTLDVPAISLRG